MRAQTRHWRRAAALLALIALVLGGLRLATVRADHARAAAAASARAEPLRFAWRAATAYVYALELTTSQRATAGAPAKPIDGNLAIEAELSLRCYEAGVDRFLLGFALTKLGVARLAVGGVEDASLRRELVDAEAIVAVDDRGRVASIRQPDARSESAKRIMAAIVGSVGARLADDAAELWEADEPTLLGEAHARYQRDVGEDGAPSITRHRSAYASLLGAPRPADAARATVTDSATITLRDGAIDTLTADESVEVPASFGREALFGARVRTRAKLLRTEPLHATAPVLAAWDAPSAIAPAAASKSSTEQLAGDMTLSRVETTLAALGAGVPLPTGFVTAAVAFLQAHPEQSQGLVDLFERPVLGTPGRALVCDLLASAGHSEAQAALRDALASTTATKDRKEFGALLQRFSLVATPTRESLDFVARQYQKPIDRGTKAAAAFALGSTIGNTARGGDRAAATAYASGLRSELAAARREQEKETLLAALGNAGLPENVAALRALANDPSAAVRAQVAYSLRKTDDDGSRATLFDLVTDADPGVTIAALDVLGQAKLDRAALARIADYAKANVYDGPVAESLITFVGRQHDDLEAATKTMQAVAAHAGDPRTRARAQIVLESLARSPGT